LQFDVSYLPLVAIATNQYATSLYFYKQTNGTAKFRAKVMASSFTILQKFTPANILAGPAGRKKRILRKNNMYAIRVRGLHRIGKEKH
jgi:hypothetical protein